jgi:hypothetical protein
VITDKRFLPSCIVVMIVLSACFTTSNTLRPVLSAGEFVVGSAGMGAALPIEPDTSITQQISNGARLEPWPNLSTGFLGGVIVTRTCLASTSADIVRDGALWSGTADIVMVDGCEESRLTVGPLSCIEGRFRDQDTDGNSLMPLSWGVIKDVPQSTAF